MAHQLFLSNESDCWLQFSKFPQNPPNNHNYVHRVRLGKCYCICEKRKLYKACPWLQKDLLTHCNVQNLWNYPFNDPVSQEAPYKGLESVKT